MPGRVRCTRGSPFKPPFYASGSELGAGNPCCHLVCFGFLQTNAVSHGTGLSRALEKRVFAISVANL